MKKRFLFLAMFMLALIFAGHNKVFGQTVVYKDYVEGTVGCVAAKPLTCAGTSTAPELNPKPGVTYNYSISTDPTTVGSVLWFVTDQATIIDGSGTAPVLQTIRDARDGTGTYILNAENGVYNTPAITTKDIDISWKNFDGTANKVLLVAYVTGAAGCSDNVEVWRIEPVFNFTLDVLSMFDNGTLPTTGNIANECVSPVERATYDGNNLTMNYGKNYIFFSVNAANFVGSWKATMSATTGNGTIGTIRWAYPADAISGTAAGWHDPTTDAINASAAATNGVVGPTGECIVVRVEVINGSTEAPVGATPNTVTLSVDGVMHDPVANNYTNTTLQDMDEPTTGTACVNNITDKADYRIDPRPAITEVNPVPAPGAFEPKN